MARKKDKDQEEYNDILNDGEETEGKGSKIISALIGIIIFVIFLGIVALLIKLDIGGFGTQVLRPVLKDVPVLSSILPDVSDSKVAFENGYDYDNLSDAIEAIDKLQKKNQTLTTENKDYAKQIKQLKAEVKRLKVFEDNQDEFGKEKKEFDQNVVFNDKAPEIEEYKKYYEEIDPDNAKMLYQQVIEQLQADEKIKEQAERYSRMEPAQAASALQLMTGDLDLVADILETMKPAASSQIMNSMDPNFVAKITKKMSLVDQK